jgi:hypothetical protein
MGRKIALLVVGVAGLVACYLIGGAELASSWVIGGLAGGLGATWWARRGGA